MIFGSLTLLSILSIVLSSSFNDDNAYFNGPWRKSLDSCWTQSTSDCNRVLTTAHGGEWNVTFPYDSFPAMETAYYDEADAVKGDFRVAKDNIGVVMHSSPVEFYESINCRGKYVEDMTSDECSRCQMEVTQYTFMTVPYFLSWAGDKVNVMFCVKQSKDIPRAITTLLENNASHRAFLEVHVNDLLALEVNDVPHWDEVYYVAEMSDKDQFESMLSASDKMRQRAFLLEFHDWENWEGIAEDVATAKAAGFRTFAATHDNPITATVENHLNLYNTGIDVAYTYNLTNAVQARKIINTQNKVVPP